MLTFTTSSNSALPTSDSSYACGTSPSRGTKARRRWRSRTCLPLRELFHAHSIVAASQMGTCGCVIKYVVIK